MDHGPRDLPLAGMAAAGRSIARRHGSGLVLPQGLVHTSRDLPTVAVTHQDIVVAEPADDGAYRAFRTEHEMGDSVGDGGRTVAPERDRGIAESMVRKPSRGGAFDTPDD